MSATVGRPPIGPPIMVRLPEPMLTALDEQAAASGVKRAEIIRQLLSTALASSASEQQTLGHGAGIASEVMSFEL